MIYNKEFIGVYDFEQYQFRYYIIKKLSSYGIEIEQVQGDEYEAYQEYFTEDKHLVYTLGEKIQRLGVSPVHLSEIIDDIIQ